MALNAKELFDRREKRVRFDLKKKSHGKLRLSVFRSSKQIYAQIIDDIKGVTLVSASSLDEEFKGAKGTNKDAAAEVGKLLAARAVKAGIAEVVFDRGGYMFHGRVKALADGAREAGLKF